MCASGRRNLRHAGQCRTDVAVGRDDPHLARSLGHKEPSLRQEGNGPRVVQARGNRLRGQLLCMDRAEEHQQGGGRRQVEP